MTAMPTTPATVLVVDDDPLNRAMLAISLGAEGHRVREAGNGLEAIAVLAEHAIDVVLPTSKCRRWTATDCSPTAAVTTV
jgi:two-component system KDP operon response regulator KdpE